MIPRRLSLRNFLSYRECSVDFTGLHTAVLSGRNGDGKSALLDAMTWALWGECRGRLEDDRIHLGEQEMLVRFEFEVQGEVFEVVRKRTRGRGAGALDFFHRDPSGALVAMTGGTLRETQQRLIATVRLDYDTFVSSAFIVQGRSNEFTRKAPADRKEVFRKILGLERYEVLATAAGDRRKDRARESNLRGQEAESARTELDELPAVEAEVESLRATLAALAPKVAELDEGVGQLRQAAATLKQLEQQLDDARRRRDQSAETLAAAGKRLASLEERLAGLDAALSRRDEITARYEELEAARKAEHAAAEKQALAATHEAAVRAAQQSIAMERTRLEAGLAALTKQRDAAAEAAAALPAIEAAAAQLAAEREAIAALDASVRDFRARESSAREAAAGHTGEAKHLVEQGNELKAREAQLEAAAATCPVCGNALGPGDAQRLRDDYAAQRKQLGERYRAAQDAAASAVREADALQAEATAAAQQVSTRDAALRARENALHAQHAAASDARDRLPALTAEAMAAEKILAEGDFCRDERAALAAAEAALTAVAYDAAAHNALRNRIRELAPAQDEYRALGEAVASADAAREQITHDRASIAAAEKAVEEANLAVEAGERELEANADVRPRLEQAEAVLAEARKQQNDLTLTLGSREERRNQLAANRARLEAMYDEMKALKEEEQIYGDLSLAFGKNGVQALLIDQSIPAVQYEANAMLDRMTGGRIHVSLHTQRAAAGGKMVDTLDIRISDDLGTRDYEMYSGGEAFRVDFALRIALARLLAQRAGATLPTLIIDEGFGTQDAEGIDRLVEAITAIKDEFRLILVVTHIDELKERFPQRIEVTKDPDRGSLARVV
ncbi:MAG: SMC family ATPase [Chloroflexi bacterium]|nr:SMC family ATPase [Chloroflexota bacterium]